MSRQIQLLFDEYKRKARLYPAMLLSIPGAFLIWGILALWKFELVAIIVSIAGTLAFCECAAIWFAVTMLSWLGNFLQDRIFEQGKCFPTTEMLLWSDSDLSNRYKRSLHKHIKDRFHLNLFSPKQESAHPEDARKVIRDAVSQIRYVVGDGRCVLQYDIHYGFVRNFIAGSPLSVMLSVCDVVYGLLVHSPLWYVVIGACGAVAYTVPILLARALLNNFGRRYARTLFAEFQAME